MSKLRQWVKAKEDEHAKTQRFKVRACPPPPFAWAAHRRGVRV